MPMFEICIFNGYDFRLPRLQFHCFYTNSLAKSVLWAGVIVHIEHKWEGLFDEKHIMGVFFLGNKEGN